MSVQLASVQLPQQLGEAGREGMPAAITLAGAARIKTLFGVSWAPHCPDRLDRRSDSLSVGPLRRTILPRWLQRYLGSPVSALGRLPPPGQAELIRNPALVILSSGIVGMKPWAPAAGSNHSLLPLRTVPPDGESLSERPVEKGAPHERAI
jgi:hypothetical protein